MAIFMCPHSSLQQMSGVNCFQPEVSFVVPNVTWMPSTVSAFAFIAHWTQRDPDGPYLWSGKGPAVQYHEQLPERAS